MKTTPGELVGGTKTRIFLAFAVSDSEGLYGGRVCGAHVENENYRTRPVVPAP